MDQGTDPVPQRARSDRNGGDKGECPAEPERRAAHDFFKDRKYQRERENDRRVQEIDQERGRNVLKRMIFHFICVEGQLFVHCADPQIDQHESGADFGICRNRQ